MRTGWWWWHLVWQSGRYRGHRAHALHGSPIDTWPRVVCPSQCTCNSKSTTSCASTCSSCTCTSHFAWRLVPTSASCRLCRTKTNLLSPLSPQLYYAPHHPSHSLKRQIKTKTKTHTNLLSPSSPLALFCSSPSLSFSQKINKDKDTHQLTFSIITMIWKSSRLASI